MGMVDIGMLQTGPVLKEKDTGDVSKFLNRILGLTVEKQNMIFTYFTECLKLAVQNAKKEGRYNEGLLDITASSVEMTGKPVQIFKDFTKGHTTTRLVELNIDRGMSWEQAVIRADLHQGQHDGFYISKREVFGRKLFLLATLKENSTHLFRIARPNTGLSAFDEEKTDLFTRYHPIERADAEKGWREQYEKTKNSCVHGSHCKNKGFCKVGSRCYSLHLLCGSIVSMMNVLENTLNRYSASLNLSKSESTIRVVRVQLNDGERVVGVRYPQLLIKEVEKALKEQKILETYQQQAQLSNFLNPDRLQSSQLLSSQIISSQLTSSQILSSLSSQSPASLLSKVGAETVNTNISGLSSCPSLKTVLNGDVIDSSCDINKLKKDNETVVINEKDSSAQGTQQNGCATKLPSSPVKAVVEKVASVSSKCLSKAMKPPVTLFNFFKSSTPSSKSNVNETNEMSAKQENSNDKFDSETSKSDRTSEMSYEEFLSRQNGSENETNDKDKAVNQKNLKPVDTINDGALPQSKSKSNSDTDTKRTKPFPSSSKKRAIDTDSADSAQPVKRAKQSTLFSAFQKMSVKKEVEEKKSCSCPICGKEFDQGISNSDLNAHIDNCIIE